MHETVRAAWVVRDEIESPDKIKALVQRAKQLNLNTLVVQVRGRGVAYYRSEIEPWHPCMNTFQTDPLALLLQEATAVGIEVHAWINALFSWSEPKENLPQGHVLQRHPDWAMADIEGKSALEYTPEEFQAAQPLEGVYLCPSRPEVRKYLSEVYAEVAQNYPVAGVHFDYIRYASPKFCFCTHCIDTFCQQQDYNQSAFCDSLRAGTLSPELLAAYNASRREWVNATVTEIVGSVRAHTPAKLITAAVFPGRQDAFDQRFQDWAGWAAQGYLDGLFPMAYSADTPTVMRQLGHMMENVTSLPVVAGLGAYRQTPALVMEKIQQLEGSGTRGFCLFAMKSLATPDWDVMASA